MRPILDRARVIFVALGLTLISACGSTPSSPAEAATKTEFRNFLVIGITGNYETRAHFERTMVSQLRQKGATASAYYSVAGGNKAVATDEIVAAIEEQGFDAILVVRRLDSDVELKVTKSRTETDATPIGGRVVNLFRSDYTDYTNPGSVDLATNALLAIELYRAESEQVVYQFDHQTKRETNLGLLIEQTAETIVSRLDRQGLIAD